MDNINQLQSKIEHLEEHIYSRLEESGNTIDSDLLAKIQKLRALKTDLLKANEKPEKL